MSVVFMRLKKQGIMLPDMVDSATNQWIFSQNLANKPVDFFRQLVGDPILLRFEYSVFCTRFIHDVESNNAANIVNLTYDALAMAELLEIIYRDYLNVPREIIRLRHDQAIYRTILKNHNVTFTPLEKNDSEQFEFDSPIQYQISTWNWHRLGILRVRRCLNALDFIPFELSSTRFWMSQLNRVATPVLTYVSWMYFIPRLSINLAILAKHTIPGWWITDKAYQLGWQARFLAEWEKRWFGIGNDAAGLTAGLINCFILTGASAPYTLYTSMALQAFDMMWAMVRISKEISRLKGSLIDLSDDSRSEDVESYRQFLNQRIAHEQNRLWLNVINTSVLLLSLVLAMPALAFHPVIPATGAFMAAIMTATCYLKATQMDSNKPKDDISVLEKEPSNHIKLNLFRPMPSDKKTQPSNEYSPTETNNGIV